MQIFKSNNQNTERKHKKSAEVPSFCTNTRCCTSGLVCAAPHVFRHQPLADPVWRQRFLQRTSKPKVADRESVASLDPRHTLISPTQPKNVCFLRYMSMQHKLSSQGLTMRTYKKKYFKLSRKELRSDLHNSNGMAREAPGVAKYSPKA